MKLFLIVIIAGFLSLSLLQANNQEHPVNLTLDAMNPAPTNAVFTRSIAAINTYLKQYQPPNHRYQLHIFDCRQFAMALINDAHTR